MTTLMHFHEALEVAQQQVDDDDGLHILLGNGFSIGAHDKFRYGSIYEQARASTLNARVDALFGRYGTANFESVLRNLNEAAWIAAKYELRPTETNGSIEEDYESLKRAFIQAVGEVHPRQSELPEDAITHAGLFLKKFSSVFTLCYDLLLYWVMMNTKTSGGSYHFQDGFNRSNSPSGNSSLYYEGPLVFQEIDRWDMAFVHFLHGALHLATQGGEVQKLNRMDSDFSIVEQVEDNIDKGYYPLIVSEGIADSKRVRIESSSYLSWVFGKFRHIKGVLFVYGASLSEEDRHIREAIIANTNVKHLYFGIYGNESDEDNRRLIASLEGLEQRRAGIVRKNGDSPLTVSFYRSATASVWGT